VRLVAGAAAALALLLSGCGPRDVQRPDALLGRWQGHVAWRDATTPVALEVTRDGDSLAATLDAPALGVHALRLGRLAYAAPRVHFSVPDSAGALGFDGWLRRGLLVGALSSPAPGGETNPSRQPQLAFGRAPVAARKLPWPAAAGVGAAPPILPAPERSLGAWLRSRAAR